LGDELVFLVGVDDLGGVDLCELVAQEVDRARRRWSSPPIAAISSSM
jgi:hypothetical protein